MRNEFRNIQENVYEAKLKTLQNNLDAIIREQTYFYTRTIYELIDRIDKAIGYIEDNVGKDDNGCGVWWYAFQDYQEAKDELLSILRGKDNESN